MRKQTVSGPVYSERVPFERVPLERTSEGGRKPLGEGRVGEIKTEYRERVYPLTDDLTNKIITDRGRPEAGGPHTTSTDKVTGTLVSWVVSRTLSPPRVIHDHRIHPVFYSVYLFLQESFSLRRFFVTGTGVGVVVPFGAKGRGRP